MTRTFGAGWLFFAMGIVTACESSPSTEDGGGGVGGDVSGGGGADAGGGGQGGSGQGGSGQGGDGGSSTTTPSQATLLVTTQGAIGNLTIRMGKLFWVTSTGDPDLGNDIQSVALTGGVPDTLVEGAWYTELSAVTDSAIYYDVSNWTVNRVALDGSSLTEISYTSSEIQLRLDEVLLLAPQDNAFIGASFPEADGSGSGYVVRMPLDGGDVEVLATVGSSSPGESFDAVIEGADVFFIDRSEAANRIQQIADGASTVVTGEGHMEHLRATTERLYWVGSDKLWSARRDGEDVRVVAEEFPQGRFCAHDGWIYFIDGFLDDAVRRIPAEPAEPVTTWELAVDSTTVGPSGEQLYPYSVVCDDTGLYMATKSFDEQSGEHYLLGAAYPE